MTTNGFMRERHLFTYSIAQLCREFDATARALRFYEAQGLLSPGRQGLMRVYTYRDRARVKLIVRGRRMGLSVADIRDILEAYDSEGEGAQRAKALEVFARRIEDLQLQRLEIDKTLESLRAASRQLADRAAPGGGIAAE